MLLVLSAVAGAQQAKPLRELSTDRPDRTESPITVDKGHTQVELEFASFAKRRSVHSYGLLGINAKLGLSDNVDFQLVTQLHQRVELGSATASSTLRDLTGRLKINLWGNDGGPTAFALMPFVTVSRGATGAELGLIAPWSRDISDAWSIGAMSEIGFSSFSDPTLVNTLTFGRSFTDAVGAFFELASEIPDLAPNATAWTFDTGVTRRVGPNLQFDGGVNIGLNTNAEQVRVFVGMSRRY